MTADANPRLTRLPDGQPWRERANAYLSLSCACNDDLLKLGYRQLAEYCERMAEREARDGLIPPERGRTAPRSS